MNNREKASAWLKDLYERFAPARDDAAKYGEAEIDADIDQAVAEVRFWATTRSGYAAQVVAAEKDSLDLREPPET